MNLAFILEFIKHPKKVGAIAPSSPYLAEKMTPTTLIDPSHVIVELGAGQGHFTKELVRKKHSAAQLVIIESNQSFYEKLVEEYQNEKGVIILNESAEHLVQILDRLQIKAVDLIVSGLPFSSLGLETSNRILKQVNQVLSNEGNFLTFQYSRLRETLLGSQFDQLTYSHVMLNLPPAYIYQGQKKKGGA